MNSPYNSTRLNMSNEAICPISLNVIKENKKSHPRQTVYIADTKNSKSIPYEVETIKKWIDIELLLEQYSNFYKHPALVYIYINCDINNERFT